MKWWTTLAWLALVAGAAAADSPNRIPQDEAKAYAKLCAERAAAVLTDAQIGVDVDPDKPCAERGEGGGAMVVPDRKLTEKVLAGADKDIVPVGQLWLRKWTLVVNGKPVTNDKLRIITVTIEDKERPMPLLLLGVRKKGDKDLELVVYAKDSEPLQVVPLTKRDTASGLPLELEWSRGDKDADNLTLNILGKYQTVLKIGRQESP
jgi:hypothetical protein